MSNRSVIGVLAFKAGKIRLPPVRFHRDSLAQVFQVSWCWQTRANAPDSCRVTIVAWDLQDLPHRCPVCPPGTFLIHITKKQPEAPNQDKKGTGTSEEQYSLGYRQALSCLWLFGMELVLKLLQDTRSKEAIMLHTGGIGNQTGDTFFFPSMTRTPVKLGISFISVPCYMLLQWSINYKLLVFIFSLTKTCWPCITVYQG